jgi:hypothetical protein
LNSKEIFCDKIAQSSSVMMSGVRRVNAEWFAMKSGGFLCDRIGGKPGQRDKRIVRRDAGHFLVGRLAGDDFAQGEISEAHSGRSQDQGPVASHQLPDAKTNHINEKMLIGNDDQGAVEKSGLHKNVNRVG